ncbi:MAG: hypothetical protein PHT69_13045 [Bacteroidales bacterium]|nr:hypothetical protein [Bacteroidales bacterium]
MTKYFYLLLLLLASSSSLLSFSQPPQMFNYQAVVRNSSGALITNQNVSIQVGIKADSVSGTLLFKERHFVTTNTYGLVNLKVGSGTVVSGNFSNINWQTGSKFIEIACDVNGGTTFTVMGTTQLLSVPYALYAETSGASGVIGPTGPTGVSCLSLNDAYNGCAGNGSGNQINVLNNKIDIALPASSTADQSMALSIQKGSNASPAYGISISHQQHGHGLFADMTNTANTYSAIKGILRSNNTNTAIHPAAISGIFDGSGCGTGVWGEITSSAATGSGAGLYGMASNNNFGGILSSSSYPGLNCKTGNATSQAAQIVSANSSFTNPSLQVRGWTQMDCSPSTASSILINNLSSEPTIATSAAQFGYIGTNSYPWYYLYYMNAIQVSSKETKRSINYLDKNLLELVIADIDKITPSFYKYNIETDSFMAENPSKYRPQYHLGLILEDTPDYLQDNTFSGIDIYALATLNLAGVKYNRSEIQHIKHQLENQTLTDFGRVQMNGSSIDISFNADFISKLDENEIPVVMITPNSPNVIFYLKNQTSTGFTLEISNASFFEFNWVAYARAHTTVNETVSYETRISPEILSNIRINSVLKQNQRRLMQRTHENLMELK